MSLCQRGSADLGMSGAMANPFDLAWPWLGSVLSSFTSGHCVNDRPLSCLTQLKDPSDYVLPLLEFHSFNLVQWNFKMDLIIFKIICYFVGHFKGAMCYIWLIRLQEQQTLLYKKLAAS